MTYAGRTYAGDPYAAQRASGPAAQPTGPLAVTLPRFGATLAGTSTPPARTGTLAATLPRFSASATGTSTPPARAGALTATLPRFTAAVAGTYTPGRAGVLQVSLPTFSATLAGARTLPATSAALAVTLPPFTAQVGATVPGAAPGTYTALDLSTATLYYGSIYANGAIGDGTNGSDFSFPGFVLDPATRYEFQVDLAVPPGWTATTARSFVLFSQGPDGPDASNWWTLGGIPVPGSGTYTLTVGPGTESWDGAVADGENRVTFETGRLKVTGLRWRVAATTPPAVPLLAPFTASLQGIVAVAYGTDTTYRNDGYSYTGSATLDYRAPVAAAPPGVVRRDVRRVHQSLPTPTLVRGRPQ